MNVGRRGLAAGVYLATALLAAMVAVVGYVASIVPITYNEGGSAQYTTSFAYFLPLGVTVAAAVVLAGLALTEFPFTTSPAPAEPTLAYLGARLRYAHSRVQELPGEVRVRLGSWAVVRLRAKAQSAGSQVTFRAGFTPQALGTIVLLLVLTPLAIVSIPIVAAVFLAARSFALRRVAPLIPEAGPLPEPSKEDEVRVLLVSGLAEGHRLAAEAYEAERSTHHDTQALVLFGALLLWGILLIAIFTSYPIPDQGARIWTSTWASLAGAIAFWIGIGVRVYRRFRPRLRRYRSRAEQLRETWEREVSRAPYPHEGPSAFEVLAESSREVPEWLDVTRRTAPTRDPGSGLLFVAMVFLPFYLIPAAIAFALMGDLALAAAIGGIGGAVLAVLIAAYRRLKARWDREFAAESERWNRRFDELRARFDRYLEGL